MFKTPNEVALTQKVEELEKKIKEYEIFERDVTVQIGTMMMSVVLGPAGSQLFETALRKCADIVSKRIEARKKM